MRYYVTIGDRTLEVDLSGATPVVEGRPLRAEMSHLPGTAVRSLLVDGRVSTIIAEPGARRGDWQFSVEGRKYPVEVVDERTRTIREMTSGSEAAVDRCVRAPMPGLVARIEVEPGDEIRAGQGLVVVEAMKMENELKAPADGVVARIEVVPGQTVEKGTVLIVLE